MLFPGFLLNMADPVERSHQWAPDAWWLALPGGHGTVWRELMGSVESTTGLHARLTNMPATVVGSSGWDQGPSCPGIGGRLSFDGSNDYAEVVDHPLLSTGLHALTLIVDVFPRSLSGFPGIVGRGNSDSGTSGSYLLYMSSGTTFGWVVYSGGARVVNLTTATGVANRWQQIGAVYHRAVGGILFVDGVRKVAGGTPSGVIDSPAFNFLLGSNQGNASKSAYPMSGLIASVRFYRNRIFADTTMRDIFNHSRMGHPGLLRGLPPGRRTGVIATEVHVSLTLTTDDAVPAFAMHAEAHASLTLTTDDVTLMFLLNDGAVHTTLTLTTEDAVPAFQLSPQAHVTLGLTTDDVTLLFQMHTLALHAMLALTTDDAVPAFQLSPRARVSLALTTDPVTILFTVRQGLVVTLTLTTADVTINFLLKDLNAHVNLGLTTADVTIAIAMHVDQLDTSPTWLAAAAHAATLANTSGQYQAVLFVTFLTLDREFTTRDVGTEAEGFLSRLDQGGVGAISRDLDEQTDTIRLGGASFSLINQAQLAEEFGSALTQLPVTIEIGFVGTGARQRIFSGVVDRWEVTRETLTVSAVPASLHDRRPLSITVREIANLFPQAFPELPSASADITLPIYLGKALSVPLIDVGRNTYLSGFGLDRLNAIRDNDEELLSHGDRPLYIVYQMTVLGLRLLVIKIRYDIEGRRISVDINNEGASEIGVGSSWPSGDTQPYDFVPRPRHNLFTDGSFETNIVPEFSGISTAPGVTYRAEITAFPTGSGKAHDGQRSLRIRSSEEPASGPQLFTAEDQGGGVFLMTPVPPEEPLDYRYSLTMAKTMFQAGSSAFHLSFWYIAGSFIDAGNQQTEQVNSQLSIKINSLPWTTLESSSSFDQMSEFTTTFVALDGTVNLQIRCEGLSADKSADIYLDDFLCWGEDQTHPFVDFGVHPVDAMTTLMAQWLPGASLHAQSFLAAAAALPNWFILSILPGGTDILTLLEKIASQCKSLLLKDPYGVYRLESLDAVRIPAFSFATSNIVAGSVERMASPADSIFSSFLITYSHDNGAILLTPDGTTLDDNPNNADYVAECAARAALLGGDHRLTIASDLLLDRNTAVAALLWAFTRHGVYSDVLRWRTWLDALPLQLAQDVTVTHLLLPFAQNPLELIGWHFQPAIMQLELVGRGRQPALTPPDEPSAPVAHPINLFTPAGVPVGASIPFYVTPAPGAELDLTSVLVSDPDPDTSGSFAVSLLATVVFTPAPGFSGIVTALYSIADVLVHRSNDAQIRITVGDPVQLVVANPDEAETPANVAVEIEVFANDEAVLPGVIDPSTVDLDPGTAGRQITFEDEGHGVFEVDEDGVVTFTPETDYQGPAVALYTIEDDLGHLSNPTTITVTVGPPLEAAWFFSTVFPGNGTAPYYAYQFASFPEFDTFYLSTYELVRGKVKGMINGALPWGQYFDPGSGSDGAGAMIYCKLDTSPSTMGVLWAANFGSDVEIYQSTNSIAFSLIETIDDAYLFITSCYWSTNSLTIFGSSPGAGNDSPGIWVYNAATQVFTNPKNFDTTYFEVTAVVVYEGIVYAAVSRTSGDAEIWKASDSAAATWTLVTDFPGFPVISGLAVAGGDLYALMCDPGVARAIYVNLNEDPDTTWSLNHTFDDGDTGSKTTMLIANATHLFAGFGNDTPGNLDAVVWRYDVAEETWELSADFNAAPFNNLSPTVSALGLNALRNRVYAALGDLAFDVVDITVYAYPTADEPIPEE